MPDKFTATWISHTSLSDFLECPRAYYLKNVYKDPKSNHKIQLMSPALALGQAVHEVLENLSEKPTDKRFEKPLLEIFADIWKKVSGKKGGFTSAEVEERYKLRGEAMLRRATNNPGPLANLAIKIKQDIPHYWLSESDEIILCGKIDWLEYLPDQDAVNILDFKTSKSEENESSLQLPIYSLLVHNVQKRKVAGASYWYLEFKDELTPKELPNLEEAHNLILEKAKQVKLARKLGVFKCPQGTTGCRACKPFERILKGEGELVNVNDFNQDVYVLSRASGDDQPESVIL